MGYITNIFERIENTVFCINKVEAPSYDCGIKKIFEVFYNHKKRESFVFFIGNGGSAAIASHMTIDFMKNGGMRTISLLDSSVITCMANDYGYDYVFSKPLSFLARKGDLLVAISSSGNSKNILNAIETAKKIGVEVISFTGFREDNRARSITDNSIYVPCKEYGTVETIHSLILQQIVDMILDRDGVAI